MSVKLSVGVDLGSANTAVSVFHHTRQCAIPLEIGDEKILPTCIAVPEGREELIVGRRAFTRPARRCDGVLCAYRQMMYGQEEAWSMQRSWCNQKWHFDAVEDGNDTVKKNGGGFKVRGRVVSVKDLISEVLDVVCTYLLEAARPGGRLEVGYGQTVSFVTFGVSVVECFTEAQRDVVRSAAQAVVRRRLSPNTQVHVVTDTLASAIQMCTIAPFSPRTMLIVDFGASKLSVSMFSFEESPHEEMAFTLREVASRTNVFVGGDEMEYRMLKWCEDRKPFPESLLAVKSATFKLRREVRTAIKTLTVAEEAMIDVDHLLPEKDLIVMLRLEDFERECSDIFESVGELVDEVVRQGQMGFPQELVLVGGCTRVPRVQKVLGRMATAAGSPVRKTLDLDRAVSLGVATVCALKHDSQCVRVPLDKTRPYWEQETRIQEGPLILAREQSSYSSEIDLGSGQPNDVMSLRALCKQLRRQNTSLLESESRLRGQLLLQQEAIETGTATATEGGGGAGTSRARGGSVALQGGAAGDARVNELLERCRRAEDVAKTANERVKQLQAEKEQLEAFAERRVRAAEESAGDLRHKFQSSQKDLQKADYELRRLREEVATLRKDAASSQAKATRYEEEISRLHADFNSLKVQLHQLQPSSRTPSLSAESPSSTALSRHSNSFSGSASPAPISKPSPNHGHLVPQAFIPEQSHTVGLARSESERVGVSRQSVPQLTPTPSLPARNSTGGDTQRSYAARQLRRFWKL